MVGRRRMRTIHRDDINAAQHLVQRIPIGCFQFGLGLGMNRLAVVIMNAQSESTGAARHGGANPAHADNAKSLAIDPVPQHACWRPARPFT